jgi:tape measure domain-containing protein
MAQNIIFRVVADTQPAVDGMNKLGNATDKTKKEVSGLDQALGKVGNMLEGAFSLDSIIAFGKQVFTLTGQVQSLTIRMNELMGSQSAGTQQMNSLRELSDKLGMSFKTVSNEFVSFVGAAKASGMEVGKAEKIFKSMTVALAGTGATSESVNRAMTALTQMIGKGKISAEELRGQLGEAMPSAMGIMAKSLGVTTQQLDKMMASGQLIAEDVLPKFAKEAEKAFGKNAQTMAEGMQGNMARLQNAWEGYMTSLGERFYGSAGGAQVLTDMLNWWTQINLTQEQYIRNESARLADASAEIGVAEKLLETQRERKKTSEEIQATFKRLQADEMAYAKERKALGDTEGYTMAVKTAFAYSEIVKSMDVEIAKKKEVIPLTNAQIKQIEKERLERARLKREMDKALKDIFTVDFTKKVEDPNLIGAPKPDDKYFKDAQDRRTKDEQDRLKEMRKWQGIFETEQGKAFQSELSELDQQYQAKLIKDEEYLVALSALRKKYGIEDKKNTNSIESDIVSTKAKKEQLKRDIVIETARGTVDTIMAYKQKELDGEAEMVAKQREQGLISQEQYDQQLRAIKRKQAIADRIAAIAQIAINTAVALTNPTNIASFGAISPFIIASGAIQAGIVLAQPLPYNKGTKRVPMMRGAVRGRDSVHAILTPDERVVPADINMQPGYSALLDLAQDKKISDKEAGFLAELATSGMRRTGTQQSIDPDVIGKAIAKHIPHTNVAINDRGIAVITERSQTEIRRLRRRIG